VPRQQWVRDAYAAAVGLGYDEYGRRTLPLTFSRGWAERNAGRFEAILAARGEHPTPDETLDAHINACYAYYARGREVERIDAPALVVHGDEDLIVPVENGRMLAARLPSSRYVELAGVGHNVPLEAPETFNALVLEFLAP
jgi:pimeloyl-ACP methyl ester carboxylesterase